MWNVAAGPYLTKRSFAYWRTYPVTAGNAVVFNIETAQQSGLTDGYCKDIYPLRGQFLIDTDSVAPGSFIAMWGSRKRSSMPVEDEIGEHLLPCEAKNGTWGCKEILDQLRIAWRLPFNEEYGYPIVPGPQHTHLPR